MPQFFGILLEKWLKLWITWQSLIAIMRATSEMHKQLYWLETKIFMWLLQSWTGIQDYKDIDFRGVRWLALYRTLIMIWKHGMHGKWTTKSSLLMYGKRIMGNSSHWGSNEKINMLCRYTTQAWNQLLSVSYRPTRTSFITLSGSPIFIKILWKNNEQLCCQLHVQFQGWWGELEKWVVYELHRIMDAT